VGVRAGHRLPVVIPPRRARARARLSKTVFVLPTG
jgi:hypothetical protein